MAMAHSTATHRTALHSQTQSNACYKYLCDAHEKWEIIIDNEDNKKKSVCIQIHARAEIDTNEIR